MKVAIIGAGAMGQLFGAKMVDAGEDVVFLDVDQSTVDALNNAGIEVVSPTGEGSTKVAATASRPQDWNEAVDFALFFVKGFHTQNAIDSARHLFDDNTIALTLQNGLGNGEYSYQMANAVTFFIVLAILAFVQLKFFSGKEKV